MIYDILRKLGSFLVRNKFFYFLLNYTWGLPSTLLGFIILLCVLPFGKVHIFHGYSCLYFKFNKHLGYGFSIGTVIFVGNDYSNSLLLHEFGHTVQNALFGPFTLFLVSIPSVIRYHIFEYYYKHNKTKYSELSYDKIWFEKMATQFGYYLLLADPRVVTRRIVSRGSSKTKI
jgi:hypothetical protein